MVPADAVKGDPDRVGVNPGEVLLGVRGDCHGEETDPDSRVYDVVDGLAVLFPEGRLAAFQIDETGAGCVGASQRLTMSSNFL